MRFHFLNQYYPPDVAPTGVMLEAVVERLCGEGHECVVWCSGGTYGTSNIEHRPSDAEHRISGGARVLRIGKLGAGTSFFGKLWGWLGFYLALGWRLLLARDRPDVIVAMTTPPFLSVLARVAAWRHGARHAHWVMDLYPDVMAAHGMLKESGWIYQVLAGLARWGFGGTRCAALLTLGPDMAERVEELRNGSSENVEHRNGEETQATNGHRPRSSVSWVPLWSGAAGRSAAEMEASARGLRRERGWGEDEVVILYSGNLGRGHLVAPMLECARGMAGGGQRLRWVFCAHGARLEEVRQFAAEHPKVGVEFLEPVPSAMLDAHLASADVHLASLNEMWTGCMVPSKLQGIFAVGRPVVFLGSAESSIGQWVRASGGGWAVRPGDAAGLRAAIEAACDPSERAARGLAARVFAATHFDRATNVARVAEVLGRAE